MADLFAHEGEVIVDEFIANGTATIFDKDLLFFRFFLSCFRVDLSLGVSH
jgi:hypothetical protein